MIRNERRKERKCSWSPVCDEKQPPLGPGLSHQWLWSMLILVYTYVFGGSDIKVAVYFPVL